MNVLAQLLFSIHTVQDPKQGLVLPTAGRSSQLNQRHQHNPPDVGRGCLIDKTSMTPFLAFALNLF